MCTIFTHNTCSLFSISLSVTQKIGLEIKLENLTELNFLIVLLSLVKISNVKLFDTENNN